MTCRSSFLDCFLYLQNDHARYPSGRPARPSLNAESPRIPDHDSTFCSVYLSRLHFLWRRYATRSAKSDTMSYRGTRDLEDLVSNIALERLERTAQKEFSLRPH